LQNDRYAHKIKEIMNFKADDYEILLYFDFHIMTVMHIKSRRLWILKQTIMKFCCTSTFIYC